MSAEAQKERNALERMKVRVRCLELAMDRAGANDRRDVQEIAEDLWKWVTKEDSAAASSTAPETAAPVPPAQQKSRDKRQDGQKPVKAAPAARA